MDRFSRRGLLFGGGLAASALVLGTAAVPGLAQQAFYVPAPELVGGPWINAPGGKPVTLAARMGKVVILHFWTFG